MHNEAKPRNAIEQQFDRFNQKYWNGRLPQYRVFESDKYGGHGLCRSRHREIHIFSNMRPYLRKKILLHEMCHAAANGWHGKAWRAEMLRIAALGAPTKQEALVYASPQGIFPFKQMICEFYDAGFEYPQERWSRVKITLAYPYSLVDKNGKPENRAARNYLRKLRTAFYSGQRERRSMDAAQKRFGLLRNSRRRSADGQVASTLRQPVPQ